LPVAGSMLSHWVIGDVLCKYVDPIDMARWAVPRLAGGHPYTVCG